MTRELPKRLSYEDAAFINFERETMPLNVGSVGIYEGVVSFASFVAHTERRIDLIPRYRHRLVPAPFGIAHQAWIEDPHFDITRHIRSVTLPHPGSRAQLAEVAGAFFAEVLPRDKPLWEILLVHGVEGHHTAHIAKVHHCMVDGVSGVELLAALLDLEPKPPAKRRRAPRRKAPPLPSDEALLFDALADRWLESSRVFNEMVASWLDPRTSLRSVDGAVKALGEAAGYLATPAPETPWSVQLSGPTKLAWQALPFAEVHDVATALGGTINDVVLTALAGALSRHLADLGAKTEGVTLRAACPVNVRDTSQADSLGNRVSFMLAGLPMFEADPVRRFNAIHAEVAHIKDVKQPAGIDTVMQTLGRLPAPYHQALGRFLSMPNTISNLICTNVPGPLVPLYLMRHRMEEHYPWVPLGWRMGLSFAVMSYDKNLWFGIVGDREVPGDLDRLARHLHEAFAELRDAVLVPAVYRKDDEPVAAEAQPETVTEAEAVPLAAAGE